MALSGIFGLADPAGVDGEQLARAARAVPARGEPRVWCDGPFTVGHYDDGRSWSSLHVDEDAAVVIDGRVDAALAGTPAVRLTGRTGHGLLAAAVSAFGPDSLDQLAADFALARVDRRRRTLLVARDAFGLRPLLWARRGRRVGFATDPEVLRALGLVTGEVDRERVAAYLALFDHDDEGTGLVGMRRVAGGWWIELDLCGRVRQHRWYRPEAVERRDWKFDDAVEAVSAAVEEAIVDRVRGRRVALFLSGGRDSGAVAVAAARAGAAPTCLTKSYDPGLPCSEVAEAKQLAAALGFDCEEMYVTATPTPNHLEQLVELSGNPVAYQIAPEVLAMRDGVASAGPDVVLDGEGGDDLFAAGPIATLDLLRAGHGAEAVAVARAFPASGRYGWNVVLKTLGRAVTPYAVIRPRRPPWPTWVIGSPPQVPINRPARSDRQLMLDHLGCRALAPFGEAHDRIVYGAGARMASPLLDQRVVRLALSLPVRHRVPRPGFKPLLAAAFLGEFDRSRRKTSFLPHYLAVARASCHVFSRWLGRDSLAVQQGFVRGEPPRADGDPGEAIGLLRRITLEAWLRHCR